MDKDKALEMALGQIEKQYGKGAVMKLGERGNVGVAAVPTGALSLDVALGVGGLPRGRVVEIFGPEGSGKSTLALHVVAEAQRNGGTCAYVDAEHALDPTYARAIGVDVDELLIAQPDTGEQALEITDMLIRSNALDVLAIDSVAALVPRAEIEGEMGDAHVGLQARLMSQALRKLTANLNKSGTTCIFINQLREKVGVFFGSPETTPGGRALKFYSSVRLDIRRIESLKSGSEVVGNRVRVKVVKNKCLAAGTRVFDPTTGLTHRIEEIVGGDGEHSVVAADKAGRLHVRPVLDRMDQGHQEILGVSFRDGARLRCTPDHRVLTDRGWVEAVELRTGDPVARPRRFGAFGDHEPVSPDHARMLGYLIGDGYVGGKTPVAFTNVEESLQADAIRIAESLGCHARRRGIETAFSHRIGERNELLALTRWAGIWGCLAWEKRIAPAFFASDISRDVVANLLFGIWESDGWVSREQTGALRVGFSTTSEQLAHQMHWLLLRLGVGSTVRDYDPTSQRPSIIGGRRVRSRRHRWEVRVSGIDNVGRFAEAIPMWGPRGETLTAALDNPELRRHRGSQRNYLPPSATEPVVGYLRRQGIRPALAAQLIGEGAGDPVGGLKQVLGTQRIRRDRLERLAEALDSAFLYEVLDEDVWWDRVQAVEPLGMAATYDLEVDELHNFVADDVVVHNCAAPFRQAEFEVSYGQGISREGTVLDMAVDLDIVKKSGAWYTYDDEQLGQGREKAKEFLQESPELMVELTEKVKEAMGLTPAEDGTVEGEHGDEAVAEHPEDAEVES